MIRPALRILVILVCALPLAAQAGENDSWGFFGGLNLSNMGGDAARLGDDLAVLRGENEGGTWTSVKQSATGAAFGLNYAWMFSDALGFQIEGIYVQRGVEYAMTEAGGASVTSRLKLDYLEIPLLARLMLASESVVRPLFFLGPVWGLRTGATIADSGEGQNQARVVNDSISQTAFSVVGGIGFEADAGKNLDLVLQFRYQLGLSNVVKEEGYESSAQDFMILLGFQLRPGA